MTEGRGSLPGFLEIATRTRQVPGLGVGAGERVHETGRLGVLRGESLLQLIDRFVVLAPLQQQVREMEAGEAIVRFDVERSLEGRLGVVKTSLAQQQDAEVVVDLRQVRVDLDRRPVVLPGFLRLAQPPEDRNEVGMGLREPARADDYGNNGYHRVRCTVV